jgi:acetyl esterase/lipase
VKAGTTYLTAGLASAVNTANAWSPFARRGPGSVLSFAAGFPTSELPLQTIAWQAAVTAGFATRGALKSPRGRAGLALHLASWVGLAELYRRAGKTRDIVEQALIDELGDDYRDRMAPILAPPADVPVTLRQVALPVRGWRRRYVGNRDIAYGDAGKRNMLDIWRRGDLSADAKAPVLLQIHGGAWVMGQKTGQAYPLLSHLAERGWVGVAINYRLSPRSTWPDHIVDVKRALAWIKAHIAEYGGDPEFVVISGGSAGGHLTALAALSANDPSFQPGFEEADTTVQAAVPFYGVYDFTNRDGVGRTDMLPFLEAKVMKSALADDRERWEAASPVCRVRSDAPPFFVLHGTNDSLVPVEQARRFVGDLRKESAKPVVYGELPLAQHAFDVFPSVRTLNVVHAVERFLAVVYGDWRSPTGPDLSGLPSTTPATPAVD